jgi:hypothetical protein
MGWLSYGCAGVEFYQPGLSGSCSRCILFESFFIFIME